MFASDVNKHFDSLTCKKGATTRTNEDLRKKQCEASDTKIYVYGEEIERVREFISLGRILTDNNNDTRSIDAQEKARN